MLVRSFARSVLTGSGPSLLRLGLIYCLAGGLLTHSPLLAASQEGTTGAIIGVLVEESGAPIVGATIELSLDGWTVRRTVTNAQGGFRFIALAPGNYAVRATQLGFRAGQAQRVRIGPGAVERITLRLEALPVEIEGVTAYSPPVEIRRTETDFGTRLEERAIRMLPVGHEATDLVAFTPGARPGHVWGGSSFQANAYQLDGLAANHPGMGGELVQPSLGWIESIEVRGLGAGAEHGNFQGGLINIVTKRGTNQLQGSLRSNFETHHLNSGNLERREIGSEIAGRREIDAELRGPLIRDRLFYFVSGQFIQNETRVQDQFQRTGERFLPTLTERQEYRFYGKLNWEPTSRDVFTGVFSRLDTGIEHLGQTGYEAPEATWRLTAPVTFYNVGWDRVFTPRLWTDLSVGGFSRDERRDPYGGPDVAGLEAFGFRPNYMFRNNPLRYTQTVESFSATGSLNIAIETGELEHRLKLGGEHSRGSWVDQRLRNGGMTWRPVVRGPFDEENPDTWVFAQQFIPATWGAEVDLNAEVENTAFYVQSSLSLGQRLNLTPGLRWGRWIGRITPDGGAGEQFEALRDAGLEPRIGAVFDITGRNDFVLKVHWGRYHQSMIAQFFDRIEGANVFTNEQLWYYWGPVFSDPRHTFTLAERDSLAAIGLFTLEEEIRLNETGPVLDFRQPYVDQWLVGIEKMVGDHMKFSTVYVNRQNRRMVSLVDRNLDANYTVYERVVVFDAGGDTLRYNGYPVTLRKVYVPNDAIRDVLRLAAECGVGPPIGCVEGIPPGFTLADTAWLSYDPDYVLTNVDDARRSFQQLQLVLEGSFPTWGFSGSLVFSELEGNLDTVTGYDDPAGFGPGPYVRPNELVNRWGNLENFSGIEFKLAIFGDLPLGLRGGAYWTRSTGEHFSPQFTLSGLHNQYRVRPTSEPLDFRLFQPVAGQRVLVEERGAKQYKRRASLDFRLERELPVRRLDWTVTLDMFNLFNFSDVTEVNTSVNHGKNYLPGLPTGQDPNEFFMAVWERVPPRTLRLGTVLRF